MKNNPSIFDKGLIIAIVVILFGWTFTYISRTNANIGSDSMQIHLPSTINHSSERTLFLHEIVEIPEELLISIGSRVFNCSLYPAQKENENVELTSFAFLKIIKSALSNCGINDSNWSYYLPQTIQLHFDRNFNIAPISIKNQILYQLKNLCSTCKFEFVELKIPQFVDSKGQWLTNISSWKLDVSSVKIGGSFLLPIKLYVYNSEQSVGSFWISGFSKALRAVPIAQRKLKAGQKIERDDYSFKMTDITFLKDRIPSENDLIQLTLAKNINFGQPIMFEDLQRELAVQKGQLIQTVNTSDFIEVRSMAKAEESGRIGDRIRIKTVDSNKEMQGLLIEKGVVKIE